jgi:hypothetical protein
MMERLVRLLVLALLVSLLVVNHDGIVVSAMDVEVDASGGQATTTNDATTTKEEKKPQRTYNPEVIQLASTFPTDVFLDNPDGNELALKVASKILYCRRSRNLLEVFTKAYTSASSLYLQDLEKNIDPPAGPNEYLAALGEIIHGIEDADHMYDDQTPGQVLAQMEQEGFFADVTDDIKVEYQLNPRKIMDDTKEGLMYEFIAIAQKAGYIVIAPDAFNDDDDPPGTYVPITD